MLAAPPLGCGRGPDLEAGLAVPRVEIAETLAGRLETDGVVHVFRAIPAVVAAVGEENQGLPGTVTASAPDDRLAVKLLRHV